MSNPGTNAATVAPVSGHALLLRQEIRGQTPLRVEASAASDPVDLEIRLPIRDLPDIARARRSGQRLAVQMGCSGSRIALVVTAISELARNIIMYADGGEITIAPSRTDHGQATMRVLAIDQGPGICDVEAVLARRPAGYGNSDLGLSGLRQVMDRFHIDSRPGVGTRVTCEVFVN